jgi:hypothetical protein
MNYSRPWLASGASCPGSLSLPGIVIQRLFVFVLLNDYY